MQKYLKIEALKRQDIRTILTKLRKLNDLHLILRHLFQ